MRKGDWKPPARQVELAEELPKAKALYDESVRFMSKTLSVYKEGSELPLAEAEPLILDINFKEAFLNYCGDFLI